MSISRELIKKRMLGSFNGISYGHSKEWSSLTDMKRFPKYSIHGSMWGGKTIFVYTQNPMKRCKATGANGCPRQDREETVLTLSYVHVLPKSVSWESRLKNLPEPVPGQTENSRPGWAEGGRSRWALREGRTLRLTERVQDKARLKCPE